MSHLAHVNGYYIAWEDVEPDEMLRASIASFAGDLMWLTAILGKILGIAADSAG